MAGVGGEVAGVGGEVAGGGRGDSHVRQERL